MIPWNTAHDGRIVDLRRSQAFRRHDHTVSLGSVLREGPDNQLTGLQLVMLRAMGCCEERGVPVTRLYDGRSDELRLSDFTRSWSGHRHPSRSSAHFDRTRAERAHAGAPAPDEPQRSHAE